jgi:hypothetical protein
MKNKVQGVAGGKGEKSTPAIGGRLHMLHRVKVPPEVHRSAGCPTDDIIWRFRLPATCYPDWVFLLFLSHSNQTPR